mmetsp:Transcript_53431/g.88634  ORF Transcript_53431/g.88634 Transcript_53431/m.88634 type:complete len:198 (-) Transcript_53431:112-705(-)
MQPKDDKPKDDATVDEKADATVDEKNEENDEDFVLEDQEWAQYRNMFKNAGLEAARNFDQMQARPDWAMWASILKLVQTETGNKPTSIKGSAALKSLCKTDEQKQFVDRGGRGDPQDVNRDDFSTFRNMLTTKDMGLDSTKIPKNFESCPDTLKEIMKVIKDPQKIRKLPQLKQALQQKTPDKFTVYWKCIEGYKKS